MHLPNSTNETNKILNVLKLTGFLISDFYFIASSARSEREKKSTFFTFQVVKIPPTTHIFGKIMKFPDFSLTFLVFKISLSNLQNSLTFP